MEGFLAALAGTDIASALRVSRWGYAAVNAAHILGIAMLLGAILTLDLRLLGVWHRIERGPLVRVLVPVAATGLLVAMTTGALLFSVRAPEYAALTVFQVKLALVGTGAVSAITVHLIHGLWLETAGPTLLARAGALSMACWLGALVAGRMIAFVGE